MNLRDLKYLLAVAEHRHFGRAAEACFVSQPTLSTQIKKLEESLGVTLIERTNRQVLLTPVGERIIRQAATVLREVDQLRRIAEQARDPYGGELRLGIIPTVAPYLLPRILPALRDAYPKLQLLLTEAQTAVITERLRSGDLDAVVLALPLELEPVVVVPLYREEFLLAVNESDPLAAREHVRTDVLDDRELLLLEDGHCLRDQALEVCKSSGAVENTNFSATSIETLRQMVASNIGATLMPAMAIRGVDPGIRYVRFDAPTPHRDIGIVWRGTSTRHELLSALADLLVAHLGDHGAGHCAGTHPLLDATG